MPCSRSARVRAPARPPFAARRATSHRPGMSSFAAFPGMDAEWHTSRTRLRRLRVPSGFDSATAVSTPGGRIPGNDAVEVRMAVSTDGDTVRTRRSKQHRRRVLELGISGPTANQYGRLRGHDSHRHQRPWRDTDPTDTTGASLRGTLPGLVATGGRGCRRPARRPSGRVRRSCRPTLRRSTIPRQVSRAARRPSGPMLRSQRPDARTPRQRRGGGCASAYGRR